MWEHGATNSAWKGAMANRQIQHSSTWISDASSSSSSEADRSLTQNVVWLGGVVRFRSEL